MNQTKPELYNIGRDIPSECNTSYKIWYSSKSATDAVTADQRSQKYPG